MRSNKYGNKKTEYNGIVYDSKKEAQRAVELDLLQKSVNPDYKVVKIERQPKFKVEINGKYICTYIADFKVTYADGRIEIEDVKGYRNSIYILKKKLVEALYKIKIIEI